MKRFLLSLILISVLFTQNLSLVFAESSGQGNSSEPGISLEEQKMIAPDSMILPRPSDGSMPFSGQNHFYSLVFRGNGESIVTLRVALTNSDEKNELKELELRVPKIVDPKDLSAYQILVTPPCIRYEESPVQVYPYNPKCAEYGEPDYYYYYGNGKYQKAKTEFSGDTLKITLPTAIAPNKTGSFFVYFRGFGYAKKTLFGAYKYDFESMKIEDQINRLSIGIDSDSDLFLKGVKGEVDYRQAETSIALKGMPAADSGAVANPTIDRFMAQVGQGRITKTASNLASLESYKVEGMYADSRAKLYGRELMTVLGIILFFVILVLLVLRAIQKRSFKKDKDHPEAHKVTSDEGLKRLGISAGVSFAAALVSAGYSLAIFAIASALSNLVDYQYQAIIMILLVVISFAVYVLLLIGPSVYVGLKKGIGWGVGTFVMTIVWLILFAIITVLILFIFRNEPYYPPVPLIRGGYDTPAIMEK